MHRPSTHGGTGPTLHLGILLVATALTGCGDGRPPTGLAGVASESFLQAMRLAVEDDLAAHGPLAGLDTTFIQETSNRSGPALRLAQEVVERSGLAVVVGHSNSAASLTASQVYNRHGVVQIAPTSTAPLYSRAGPFSFRMVPPDHVQGRFLARMLADSVLESGRVAVLFVNDDYGRALRQEFVAGLDPARHPVVLSLPHTEGDVQEPDTAHQLEALTASNAEVLVYLGRPPVLDALLAPLRARHPDLPVVGGDSLSRATLLSEIAEHWNGIWYSDFVDVVGSPELRGFRHDFQERFGSEPGGAEVLTYDATRLILTAFRDGARTGAELQAYLDDLGGARPPYEGLSGGLTFDENGDVEREYVFRKVNVEGDGG